MLDFPDHAARVIRGIPVAGVHAKVHAARVFPGRIHEANRSHGPQKKYIIDPIPFQNSASETDQFCRRRKANPPPAGPGCRPQAGVNAGLRY